MMNVKVEWGDQVYEDNNVLLIWNSVIFLVLPKNLEKTTLSTILHNYDFPFDNYNFATKFSRLVLLGLFKL